MFKIQPNKTIHATRGDDLTIQIAFNNNKFIEGDIINFYASPEKQMGSSELIQSVLVELTEIEEERGGKKNVVIGIPKSKIRSLVNENLKEPIILYYEIRLIRNNKQYSLIGYDNNGPKKMYIYPEAIENELIVNDFPY